jgi:hypothetical protein
VKYALVVFGDDSWDRLPADQRRRLHVAHRGFHEEQHAGESVSVIAHYRLRQREEATAIRLVGEEIVRSEGQSGPAREMPLALYLLETDNAGAVIDLATRLPALRLGGTAEIWPLTEPKPASRGTIAARRRVGRRGNLR